MKVERFEGWAVGDRHFPDRDKAEEYAGQLKLKQLIAEAIGNDRDDCIEQIVGNTRANKQAWHDAMHQAVYSIHPRASPELTRRLSAPFERD